MEQAAGKLVGRVEKKTYSGVVLEREFMTIRPKVMGKKSAEVTLRFPSAADRAEHRRRMSERNFIRLVNENFTPASYKVTLTFDRENEVYEYEDCFRLVSNYIKRLKNKYPHLRIVYTAGRGKSTKRIHVHMITDGVPEHAITSKWVYGKVVEVEHLRPHNFYDGVDCGADYTALAEYMFAHWEPEQGTHRYRRSGKMRKVKADGYYPCRRTYTEEHPPKAPKGYKLVGYHQTKYGYQCFKYVIDRNLAADRKEKRKC